MAKRLPTYRNDEITVTFDPVRCIHARRCVQGLPEVFDPKAKPWVRVDRASAELIADVIRQCPTGALHYERRSGAGETADADPTIRIGHNGPIYLRGAIELKLESGETIHRDTRVALCRCGHSTHMPFCDGSHESAGFTA